jgi:serine/threonine protein phosphatase 1
LLERELRLQPHDQLIFLGDYIDRGPESAGVIDDILELRAKGYEVHTLRGNHEQMLLDMQARCEAGLMPLSALREQYRNYKALDLFGPDGWLRPEYRQFLESLDYAFASGDVLLVHAGLASGPGMLYDVDAMLWVRQMDLQALQRDLPYRHLVHGHTPHDMKVLRQQVEGREFRINLDNGCVFYDMVRGGITRIDLGRLCALDLDTFALHAVAYQG